MQSKDSFLKIQKLHFEAVTLLQLHQLLHGDDWKTWFVVVAVVAPDAAAAVVVDAASCCYVLT